ncbi:flagellar biosynthetic protein FliQ [Rhodopirellula sp. MGV]|uniref:flagellar biosynthetic protein FliQ n=1 Tax=Rhodopirellula sp. MGV TaxID=2023130 RepID=UPI000B96DAA7|nr:flagellar biosynthetic protein FliQ [Rhodopirellula sp. MGV]OYP30360.1 flagellar biosynthetic protein FliQ [Rhodopirellula sp. MGV]PNY34715.1 flagellar biosynthetic protein FliQ [Rhodopirellula baltica]
MLDANQAVDLCRQALLLAALLAAPVLLAGAATGLLSGLVQTLFQVQDQSISFVPKLVVSSLVLLACLPWMLSRMMDFAGTLFASGGF